MFTKDNIIDKLKNDSRWMERGVIVLYHRQTEDEKKIKETKVSNNRGFNSSDCRYLTWVAEWLLTDKSNHLNEKHKARVSKMLPKYWGQILSIIKENGND
jgi:hypothetical protein